MSRPSLLVFFMALGFWRFDLTLPDVNDALFLHLGEQITMKTEVQDLGKYDAMLRIFEINGSSARSRSRLSVASAGKGMKIGETWRIVCRVEKNEKAEMKQVIFDARKGVFYRCRGSISAQRIKQASPWNVEVMLSSWRTLITQRIYRLIPGDEGALLAGILYGERGLSAQENTAFRMAGMTHIIAVSGSNITIVASMLVPLFLLLGYRRTSSILFASLGIVLFSVFVGASASVLRAALMGGLSLSARLFGRHADAYHLLILAGAVMVAFDPWALGFDAGFALSFLATWGLMVPGKLIIKKLKWLPEAFELRETFSTTFAASLATTPYQLWAFGSASLLGLVTNIFAIPLTTFVMTWGVVAMIFGDALSWIVYPVRGMLSVMLSIASFAERFPIFVINCQMPLPIFLVSLFIEMFIFQLNVGPKKTYPQIRGILLSFLNRFLVIVRRPSDMGAEHDVDFEMKNQNQKM